MIEIPKMPLIFAQGHVSNDGALELLKWRKAFNDLGCGVNFEEESSGGVKFCDGNLMEVVFDATPITIIDGPFGQACFDMDNKAHVYLVKTTSDWDGWMEKLGELGSPITEESLFGTWEEIYSAIAKYLDFSKKSFAAPEFLGMK